MVFVRFHFLNRNLKHIFSSYFGPQFIENDKFVLPISSLSGLLKPFPPCWRLCVVLQLKRFVYEKSVLDLIKFVSNIKRIFLRISDSNFIDFIFVSANADFFNSRRHLFEVLVDNQVSEHRHCHVNDIYCWLLILTGY